MRYNNESSKRNYALFLKADKLRDGGMSAGEACEKVGITKSIYGYYKYAKDSRAAKRSEPQDQVMITSLPDAPKRQYNRTGKHQKPSGKVAVVIGNRADVLGVLNEYF